MCLAGDSVDFQFYDALRLNLHRQNHLQKDIKLDISDNTRVPVNYTNETGAPPYMMWMTMDHIEETTVSLTYDSEDTPTYTTIIRYFQMYGWSPWDVPFMEDCNIVVYNLGLHYNARSEGMNGIHWYSPKHVDDFRAAITYLVDFVSSNKGVAVWRLVSTLFRLCVLHYIHCMHMYSCIFSTLDLCCLNTLILLMVTTRTEIIIRIAIRSRSDRTRITIKLSIMHLIYTATIPRNSLLINMKSNAQ